MRVGLTGGMGCGKSSAARLLERHGFRRLDSDAIVRDQALKAPEIIAALQTRFSPGVIGADGAVDRAALAARVFGDDGERAWLEALLHPVVFATWQAAFNAHPAARWVVEVPLLHELGLENWFDFTVCVACPEEVQFARLEQRGIPRGLAAQRISKQLPLARKIERSDFVLWNEGSPTFLEAQVERLAKALPAA